MIKASYHILSGILGMVLFILPGLCLYVNAQSVNLDGVSVISYSSPFVQIEYTIEDTTGPISDLVVTIQRLRIDFVAEVVSPIDDETIDLVDELVLNWTDPFTDHDFGPVGYTLSLADRNDINTVLAYTDIHQTIFFNDVSIDEIDRCKGSIELSWDNYKYFQITSSTAFGLREITPPYFTHNRIMFMHTPIGGVSGGEQVAVELDFDLQEFELEFQDGPGEYTIWVQAVKYDDDGAIVRYSNSNIREVIYDSPVLNNLDITRVNVVGNRDIEVGFFAEGGQPGDLDVFVFEVYKAASLDGEYALVGVVMGSQLTNNYSFIDTNPGLSGGPYYYYVSGRLVECEDEFEESAVMSSLFLDGAIETHTENQLTVRLEGTHFPGGLDYQLFRKLPGEADWEIVGPFVIGLADRDDLSQDIEHLAGEILYKIEGSSGADVVVSNEVSIIINVGLEIYNAFRPSSGIEANRAFRPRLRGVSPSYFRLRVFDQWGQELYSYISTSGSLEDFEGWDGNGRDGRDVAPGVYGFRLEYQVGNEERVEKTGVVTLVR